MRLPLLLVVVGLIGFASQRCLAQASATQPADLGRAVRYRQLDPDEAKAVDAWMKQRMPKLTKMISGLPESNRYKRNRLLNAGAARYRTYQQAQGNQQALEAVMRSVNIEDEIFGYIDQLDDAPAAKRAELQQKIRTRTRALVDLFLADRADRIARLRARLDAEQKTLDADRAHANLLVDQRLAHFLVESTSKPADDPDPAATTQPQSEQ